MFSLTLVKPKLLRTRTAGFDIGNDGTARVFGECAERRTRQLQAAKVIRHLQPRDEPKSLCVALVPLEVPETFNALVLEFLGS